MIHVVTHRILISPTKIEEKDAAFAAAKRAGIDLSETKEFKREQQGVDEGTVVSFGPIAFRDFGTENPLTVGDKILYARHAGKPVKDPDTDEEFLVINDEDVVCILRRDPV